MTQDPSLGPAVFVGRTGETVTRLLRIAPAKIIRSDSPQERFDVWLELNRPESRFGTSEDLARFLRSSARGAGEGKSDAQPIPAAAGPAGS
jgi:hypothetical protein